MPVYAYTYRDASGAIHKGTTEADSEEVLRKRFSEQDMQILEVQLLKGRRSRPKSFGRVKLTNLALFCRQFSTMVDAGVSLVRCLDVLAQQTTDPRLKKIILDVGERVEGGESLSRAMQRHPKAFSNLFIGLIRAGEVGGVLEEALQRLSQFLEKDVELRRKIRSALTYPTIVIFFALGIVIFLVSFIIPRFVEVFTDLGIKELPAATKLLIDISNFITTKWYFLIGGLILFLIVWKAFVNTHFGRRVVDRLKLKVPIFGKLHHKICLARFSRTLGTLLASGVPILQAMETTAGVVGNHIISDAVMEARSRIREGERIGEPLERSRQFPPMVVHMISVGEESGSLDYMLQKIADFYEGEVEATLASLTAALEPVLIVILGFIVGFIVISMFLPLIQAVQNLSQGDALQG
ncbi:MAG TPA: type II secretion system F family protein [Fimbriimonadales bacterium]|nr:type II secretion system F family protein [Fimbriimonadales bacterium]